MSTSFSPVRTSMRMLHQDLAGSSDEGVVKNGRRLDHAEGASHPIRPSSEPQPSEPQPRGAVIRGGKRVNQGEAANRFIAATQHEKMHDERLWDLRQKRDGQVERFWGRIADEFEPHLLRAIARD